MLHACSPELLPLMPLQTLTATHQLSRSLLLDAGNCGISVDLPTPTSAASPELASFAALFAEELGLVLEVHSEKAALVSSLFNQAGVPCSIIGKVVPDQTVDIRVGGEPAVSGNTAALRDVWEETSFALERLQAAEECVDLEQAGLKSRTAPKWVLPFTPTFTPTEQMSNTDKVSWDGWPLFWTRRSCVTAPELFPRTSDICLVLHVYVCGVERGNLDGGTQLFSYICPHLLSAGSCSSHTRGGQQW